MSPTTWDIIFVAAAIFGALASALYYVGGVRNQDRLLSRLAAAAFVAFSAAAVVYLWRAA